MRRRFITLDVFTKNRFSGNPLAVVINSDGLGADEMQMIAREFSLSETVFLFPPEDSKHRARVRIFSPNVELPFAGHPVVGTAVLLAIREGVALQVPVNYVLQSSAGPIECEVTVFSHETGQARIKAPQLPQRLPFATDLGSIAAALGLLPSDLMCDQFEPARFSAGISATFVPLSGLAAMTRVKVDPVLWSRVFGWNIDDGVYLYCRETSQSGYHFHGRMFAPGFDIDEDPASGAPIVGLAGVIMAFEPPADGFHTFRIEQGMEMGRPSTIDLGMSVQGGVLQDVTIAGDVVVVSDGTIIA